MYIMSALQEDHRCSRYADYLFEFKLCNISLEIPSRNVGLNPIKQQRTNTAEEKTIISCSKSYSHLPVVELGEHIVIFYVVILIHVYGELKGSLPCHKLVKPGHYLENSLICMNFQSALLTVWFAAHFILCHGMISDQT